MRLLHTTHLTLKEFIGSNIPPYAIISHRWIDDEETTHQEFLNGKRSGAGWIKISKGCEIARSRGYEWLWNDTICIDSKSSAELTEAINSMYKWYERSEECYVFLPDVYGIRECGCPDPTAEKDHSTDGYLAEICLAQFRRSTWFTRGWTLQELLAPDDVLFYNARFNYCGTKTELSECISFITNIATIYLSGQARLMQASLAQRMSWAARRQTTREEDTAYCLLGIFDVNMPLLYGEGATKAFVRLQSEIIRKSDDESIFAWWLDLPSWYGLLAPSPAAFLPSNRVTCEVIGEGRRSHYQMTNKGLQFSFRTRDSVQNGASKLEFLLPLGCYRETSATHHVRYLAIRARVYDYDQNKPVQAFRALGSLLEDGLLVRYDNKAHMTHFSDL